MDPLLIRTFGFIDRDPLHSTPGTKADDIMLNVFLEGKGYYKNQKLNCEITAGSVAIFLPDDPGVLYSDKKNPYSHYYCRFNGSFAKEFSHRIINAWGKQIFFSEKMADLVLILRKMKPEFRQNIGQTMRSQDGFLMQILLQLLDNSAVDKPNRHIGFIQYLESRISQNIDIEEMANTFHLSIRHLNRIFKSKINMSIHQYHEMIRIQLSKTLLKNTSLSIQEISLRVGYQDALYFSRIFKKNTQNAPLVWRKNNSSNIG